jgi:hypothetical protein
MGNSRVRRLLHHDGLDGFTNRHAKTRAKQPARNVHFIEPEDTDALIQSRGIVRAGDRNPAELVFGIERALAKTGTFSKNDISDDVKPNSGWLAGASEAVRRLGIEPRTYGLKVRCSTN